MPDYYTAKPADMLRQTRPRDELRLCGWVLTGFPLLWAAVPALLLAAPLLFGVALVRMNSRIERTRFLWSMAIAIEHDMNLADEIDGFAGGARWRTRERYMALAGRLRDGLAQRTGIVGLRAPRRERFPSRVLRLGRLRRSPRRRGRRMEP